MEAKGHNGILEFNGKMVIIHRTCFPGQTSFGV
jgi:hypothetical protein